MPRTRNKGAIVPQSEAPLAPRQDIQATIERMVRERVDEIMAQHDSQIFEPDFRAREVSVVILRRQSVFDRRKWSLYFEKWGCRRCDRNNVPHGALGCCGKCFRLIRQRLTGLKKKWEMGHPHSRRLSQSRQPQIAKEVLGEWPTEDEEES